MSYKFKRSPTSKPPRDLISLTMNDNGKNLSALTDQQLKEVITQMESEVDRLKLENLIFKNFLRETDASLLENMKAELSAPLDSNELKVESNVKPSFEEPISVTQKNGIALKYLEKIQADFANFYEKSNKERKMYKAEIEEMGLREMDFQDVERMLDAFVKSRNKKNKNVPVDKFIKFMQNLFKINTFKEDKLRSKIASLKMELNNLSTALHQRQESGKKVYAVELEQLKIENKQLFEKIRQINFSLIEIKNLNLEASTELCEKKLLLKEQKENLDAIKREINFKKKFILELEKKCKTLQSELNKLLKVYQDMITINDTCQIPDVIEYIQLKEELFDVQQNIQAWKRRNSIQRLTLKCYIRRMKNTTGKSFQAAWIENQENMRKSLSEKCKGRSCKVNNK